MRTYFLFLKTLVAPGESAGAREKMQGTDEKVEILSITCSVTRASYLSSLSLRFLPCKIQGLEQTTGAFQFWR
jgi:hypothetical protein